MSWHGAVNPKGGRLGRIVDRQYAILAGVEDISRKTHNTARIGVAQLKTLPEGALRVALGVDRRAYTKDFIAGYRDFTLDVMMQYPGLSYEAALRLVRRHPAAARLFGLVPRSTIRRWILKEGDGVNLVELAKNCRVDPRAPAMPAAVARAIGELVSARRAARRGVNSRLIHMAIIPMMKQLAPKGDYALTRRYVRTYVWYDCGCSIRFSLFTSPVLQQNTTLPEPESADVLPQAHRYCVLVRSPLTLCSFDDVRVCRGRVAFARADEGTRRASRNAVLRSHRKIQDSSRVRVEY